MALESILELSLKNQGNNPWLFYEIFYKGFDFKMLENIKKTKTIILIIIVAIICGIILFYQSKKVGFHEDEIYSIVSSVNPENGLMSAYGQDNTPKWITKEYAKNYITLSTDNYLNLRAVFLNQSYDNHPPFFYTLVHFSSILFLGKFTKYSVFIVNLIAFILSCFVIQKILKLLNKEHLIIGTLIFYGLSMGTITMVIYQRMYMLLTFFILLYFYYSLKIYKNNFNMTTKTLITLGVITILGFLTQYFFAIYAFFIFILMIIQMFRHHKNNKIILKYTVSHIIYAILGILLFTPCINHLLFSDRGLSNLENNNYFAHLYNYIQHLGYSFSIDNTNFLLLIFVLIVFFIGLIFLIKKSKEKFTILLTILPSIIYFFISVKLTSFQELRYIMPIIPFVCITLFFIFDSILNFKYKNSVIIILSILLSLNGIIFSKPKFLFEEYADYLEIAEQNKNKSFVYVYDNFFNHMQSMPEMMIYNKTLIINVCRDELNYIINDENLSKEDSYILCIKQYMDNDYIIEEIKNHSDFKNITELYKVDYSSSEKISNNLYLVSK